MYNKFEIYLVGDIASEKLDITELDKLPLEEKPVLTDKDITKYYWDQQVFKTDKDIVAARLKSRIPMIGTPFVVVVAGERIYMGKFWTMLSSCSPYSPSISIEGLLGERLEVKDKVKDGEQLYRIWWDSSRKDLSEKIKDNRIYEVFKNIGKLGK